MFSPKIPLGNFCFLHVSRHMNGLIPKLDKYETKLNISRMFNFFLIQKPFDKLWWGHGLISFANSGVKSDIITR